MSYKSPIELYYDCSKDMMMNLENEVMNVIYKAGVRVDKDELIRALAYDREQYELGYKDALSEAIPIEWIKKWLGGSRTSGLSIDVYSMLHDWEKEKPIYVPFSKLKEHMADDAEPVRYGRWIFNPDDAEGTCSCCQYHIYGKQYNGQYLIVPYNYCPNCGAKMEKEKINQTEMNNLSRGLTERGIHFSDGPLHGGFQIIVYDNDGNRLWDAVCHEYSYGHEKGLIEIYGSIVNDDIDDSVEGWLTAEEILKRIDEEKENEQKNR